MANERYARRASALVGAGFALLACARAEPLPLEVRVDVRAGSTPVPGAQIRVRGDYMATSDARGRATLRVTGNPGERLPVSLACPDGYRSSPVDAIELPGPGAAVPDQPLTLALGCETLLHDGVIVVHAGASTRPLPVKVDGAVVGQTDELGFAHVHVQASADSTFEVSLDTSGNAALTPANPAQRFTLREGGELFVFDAAFEDAKAARKQRGARRRPRASTPRP